MESHEEKLHKLVLQSKINETKDVMKRKANEIDKNKVGFCPNYLPSINFLFRLDPSLIRFLYIFCRLRRAEVIREGLCLYSRWALEGLRITLVI